MWIAAIRPSNSLPLLKHWVHPPFEVLSRWLRGAWHLTLASFPIPSESKWRGMVEVMALYLQTALKDQGHPSEDPSSDALARSLEHLGDHWTWRRAQWLSIRPPFPPAVRSTLVLTFKTLDMSTSLTANGPVLRAVTTRCPYLQQAGSKGMAHQVCQAMCSEGHSFFRGVARGFPFHVAYHAPAMMGHGDPMCVKVFQVMRVPKSPRRRSHSHNLKRNAELMANIGSQAGAGRPKDLLGRPWAEVLKDDHEESREKPDTRRKA